MALDPAVGKLLALGISLHVYTLVRAIEGPVVRTNHAVTDGSGSLEST
jgi:hypothetical protein